jgi:hypothetical protein
VDPKEISLLGGDSVHCINEQQMTEAIRMAELDTVSSAKIQKRLRDLELELNRNERAALAFMIIQRLKDSSPI